MRDREGILRFLLRLAGGIMLLAFPMALLPVEWMAATHRWLGLGEFPASPLVDYLTRSASLLYGFHGGLLIVAATDVRRHALIVRYVAVMNVVFGMAVAGVDLHAGLPLAWTLAEGPPVAGFGLVLLWLLGQVEEA